MAARAPPSEGPYSGLTAPVVLCCSELCSSDQHQEERHFDRESCGVSLGKAGQKARAAVLATATVVKALRKKMIGCARCLDTSYGTDLLLGYR